MRPATAIAACLLAVPAVACAAGGAESAGGDEADPATAAWARTLAAHVRDGGVDYAALAEDRADLDLYLASLADARADGSEAERIAFWINAYNAVVLERVLSLYPGIGSVQEVDGFFDEMRRPVAGEDLTLDEIETRARKLGDPRVHFAVVCASTSCPDLRAEPYVARRLDEQLGADTAAFLADPAKGLRFDAAARELWLSSIFKWYAGDFTGGSTVVAFFARGGVLDWVLGQLPAERADAIRAADPRVRYLPYDWSLNDR